MTPAATVPSGAASEPFFRIIGYEQREEYLGEAEWRRLLGPSGYRQSVASKVLLIVGGLATFSGAVALLATLGSLADNSGYGQQAILVATDGYKSYVYGFSALLATGGAMVATGLMLTVPLPARRRPLVIPRLQPTATESKGW